MKKSIIFGVLAMFAVSALSVQNVNAQNGTTVKTQPTKENVKADQKEQPKNPTQAANEPKVKVQQDQENAQKGAPIHKVKGNKSSKKTMTRETTMKKENNQSQQNANGEPQMKDMQKPGQKNDAKAVTKKAGTEPAVKDMQKPQGQKNDAKAETKKASSEPAMRTTQPKNETKAQKKEVKPDYNTSGKTTLKPRQENATRPKMKKEKKTEKAETNDIK
jgi:hypothetical protein